MAKFLALLLVCFSVVGQTLSVINTGTTSNDGTGDSLRTAFTKANTNFYQLWSEVFTNIPVDIANAGGAGKLDITNGTAVGLTLIGTTTLGASAGKLIFAQPQSGDDTTYLQGMLDSISDIPGTLVLAPGTYQVEGQGLTNYSNVRIVGYGATLSRSDTSEPCMMWAAGATNAEIRGVTFYSPTAMNSSVGRNGAAISTYNGSAANIRIVDCRFERQSYGVYGVECTGLSVIGCEFRSVSRAGIYAEECSDLWVERNQLFGDRTGVGNAVNMNVGIWTVSTTGTIAATNQTVRANVVRNSYNEGILIRGQRCVVVGNYVAESRIGTSTGSSYGIVTESPEINSTAFTVNAATDTFTSASAHGLAVGDAVQFWIGNSTNTLPSPLLTGIQYYVLTAPTATTFTLAYYPTGGTTLDVTDTGTGSNNFAKDTLLGCDIVVRDNFVSGCDGGIRVSQDPVNASLGSSYVTVTGNTVEYQFGTSLHAIQAGSSGTRARNAFIIVSGNRVRNSQGIGIYVPQAINASVVGNQIYNIKNNGIGVGSTTLPSFNVDVFDNQLERVWNSGIVFTGITQGKVSRNTIDGANTAAGTDYAINLISSTTDVRIDDNVVNSPLATFAVRVNSGTNYYGFNQVLGGTANSLNSATVQYQNIILPRAVNTLASSTAPAVSTADYWTLTMGTARTVTDFTGAQRGQRAAFTTTDNNATLDFSGSNMWGNGGLDYRMLTDDWAMGFNDGSKWRMFLGKKHQGASIWRGVTPVTVANTTSSTTLLSSTGAFGTLTLPADYMRDGKMMYVRAWGTYGTKSSSVGNLKLQVTCQGSAAIGDTGNFVLPPSMSGTWEMQFWWQPLNTGGSVSVARGGAVTFATGSGFSTRLPLNNGGSVTISTTVARTLDFTAQWGTADASNTITCSGLEFLSSYD